MNKTYNIATLLLHTLMALASHASSVPSILTEETYNQLRAGTHPTIHLCEDTILGVRHGSEGFSWDTPSLVLERKFYIQPGLPVPEGTLLYMEPRSPKNNFLMFSYKEK